MADSPAKASAPADAPASPLAGDKISQYPKLAADRTEDIVESRSTRPALGGAVSAVVVHPNGARTVFGPESAGFPAEGITADSKGQPLTRASALDVARKGPGTDGTAEGSAE